MLLQKNLKTILIPNYYIIFSDEIKQKLTSFLDYCMNISYSYYLKTKEKFYTQFSYISYNPYMYPKYISNSNKYKDCRKSFYFKYIVIYRILGNNVKILNIFHSKNNYKKLCKQKEKHNQFGCAFRVKV